MAKKDAVIIKGGTLIDPANDREGNFDLLIKNGRVEAVDKPGSFDSTTGADVHDVSGMLVTPGLLDIHVHLREPGFEWKETIETGCDAARAGGFTTICCMPNTNPVNDNAQVTRYILDKTQEACGVRVLPIGAITVGQKGEALAPMVELREAGCVAFSDDGFPVSNAAVMRKALEYSLMLNTVLTVHEEERSLSEGFAMNESALSVKLGLKGMPGAAEDVMISRDIELARLTGARVHFCHVSTARAVTLIRRAKEDGIPVTAEVTPHHITLDENSVADFDTKAKMSMPLRNAEDISALTAGLEEGVIDCIASDHAPHEADSKNREFAEASFGILGFQTTVPLTMAKVREGSLTLRRAVESLTSAPATCFGLSAGTLSVGAAADITVIDPERETVMTEDLIRSKSKNTPFLGERMQGFAVKTFVDGKEIFSINDEGVEQVING